MMRNERIIFWDVVKGLAIIAVVLIHTTSRNTAGGVIWRQFINWPVALFFFVAGYFCHIRGSYKEFVLNKAKRLLVPFAVFSLVYACLDIVMKLRHGGVISASDIIMAPLSFPLGWGYFILALFQCFLIAPIIKRFNFRLMLGLTFIGYLCSAFYEYAAFTFLSPYLTVKYSIPFVFGWTWLPLFVLGIHLQEWRYTFPDNKNVWGGIMFVLMVVCVVSGLFWYKIAPVQLARSQIRLPNILFAMVLVCGLPNILDRVDKNNSWIMKIIAQLGRESLFVYLGHRFVILLLNKFLPYELLNYLPTLPIGIVLVLLMVIYLIPTEKRQKLWWLGMA